MKVKFLCLFSCMFSLLSPALSFGFEDCFNYQCIRQDMTDHGVGWDRIKAFEGNKDNFILEKRWPTVNLKLTPEKERARFGATALEMAQKVYLARHFDGTNTRMTTCTTVTRKAGKRKIKGVRVEINPTMPNEYLDPAYPEEKKEGFDWKLLIHIVYPPDIRGFGTLIYSYNNKKKDNDTWVWFPSLRKVRRLTPANGDDYFVGSYKTFSEGFLRRITDEVSQIIGETRAYGFYPITYFDYLAMQHKYPPHSPEFFRFMNNIIVQRECWVVRSISVKGGYCDYYHTRIWLADKEWGYGPYVEEMYDKKGKLASIHNWAYMKQSGYDGKLTFTWTGFAEDINFEERGFSHWNGPEFGTGYENPGEWFTLRELMRSVPTENIPHMPILPPKDLQPLEALFPTKELMGAYRKHFPERVMSFPGEVRF